ncbi:hypothetical protein K933_14398 [Candidatus Halobonum tyrrellensis G22]|uniref:DUF58 domain-containing protein n=1 Tax=Candidatus Halobonum tyrrellensis G22 TaxID=1324957 RepID=V4HHD5_9EURY|nr:hypothetical protein K933_14398 [Candidatus Halobonum tyrrellensis G22]
MLAVVLAVAAVSAVSYGPRALNAVLIPGGVAFAAAYLQLRRADPPRVARAVPPDDHAGRSHRVRLFFGDPDGPRPDEEHGLSRPFVGVVRERVGDGLSATGTTAETVVGARPVEYEVTYESRGRRVLGPATVSVRDVLGLAETDLETAGTDALVVYPAVHPIAGGARRDLRALHETGIHRERREFDRLREYDRGDSLRDVHWKSTAKRDDLIVKEFAAEAETEAVSLAAGATASGDAADEMAEATASLVLALVDDGIPVDVHLADGSLTVGPERGSRVRLLERLAVAGPGRLPTDDVDIAVYAETDRVRVDVGDRETTFAELRAASESARAPGAVGPDAAAAAGSGSDSETEEVTT